MLSQIHTVNACEQIVINVSFFFGYYLKSFWGFKVVFKYDAHWHKVSNFGGMWNFSQEVASEDTEDY